jgi:hypothetical protein
MGAVGCIDVLQPPPPETCDKVSGLFNVDAVLSDPESACYDWVGLTAGRVGRTRNASAVVWSRRTAHGTGVVASAMHALEVGELAPAGEQIDAALHDPMDSLIAANIRFRDFESDSLRDAAPAFLLFNSEVPAGEHGNDFQNILPRHDFYVSVAGGTSFDVGEALQEPLEITDSNGTTLSTPSFGTVGAGELVLIVGFPGGGPFAGSQAASVGRVLSDIEAETAVAELRAAGDEEGLIAYDAQAEFLVDGAAAAGMSGCGAFDETGKLVGVLVRASDAKDDKQTVRIVRMSFIAAALQNAVAAADDATFEAAEPYLENETN